MSKNAISGFRAHGIRRVRRCQSGRFSFYPCQRGIKRELNTIWRKLIRVDATPETPFPDIAEKLAGTCPVLNS